MNPTIERNVRTLDQHKARWPKAIERLIVIDGPMPNVYIASEHEEHIFDFECGLRIIASREQLDGVEYIHVSASAAPQTETWGNLLNGRMNKTGFYQLVIDTVVAIGGPVLTFAFQSEGKGVPHFFYPPLPKQFC